MGLLPLITRNGLLCPPSEMNTPPYPPRSHDGPSQSPHQERERLQDLHPMASAPSTGIPTRSSPTHSDKPSPHQERERLQHLGQHWLQPQRQRLASDAALEVGLEGIHHVALGRDL